MQVLINSSLDDIRDIKSPLFVLTRGKTIGDVKIVT